MLCYKHEYSTKPARKFSCLFHCHKMRLLDLLGTDHNEQFPVYVHLQLVNCLPFCIQSTLDLRTSRYNGHSDNTDIS